ncbi:transcriptional regulator [Acinetobacter pittii]|jgi:transcriptional regulator with XRE-family HTH domain|uniref:helix-turn-helix domain-containing protein n=1 Tax=Acinetobacter TaxID=469 RepID=UPI0006662861|nr:MULTISPECIES: helix-turn-helix transcriptional regulator [Acinetobacter]MDH1520394.1 helix-turn-helix domain-containing protein [Acinetobacter johnsonii]PIL91132.1 transcriptional regulator [Acinetobacter pittii]UIP96847.1 helix-turn-helix domain-containing protein [Acinetobacter johnsonii]
MSFSSKLKELRLQKGLSLQDAANLIGISKTHFWDLETGKSKNPSYDLLEKISDKFGISISSLVNEDIETNGNEELKVLFRQMNNLEQSDLDVIKLIVESKTKK